MPNPEKPDQHRFIFKALLIENQELAKPGELVIDIPNGIVYIKSGDGSLKSATADVVARLAELESSGLIDSALAFENNTKIWTLYVANNHCRIDNALKLSRNVRYYAVRGTNAQGKMDYITGNIVNGVVENALVDVLPFTTDPVIAFPGEAQEGILHTPSEVIDGHAYFIDFFDANRYILSTVPCQAIHIQQLDFSLSPDKNIIALEITSSQDMIDPDTQQSITFLYRGQSINTVDFYVYARYSNGDRRYINHELSTSRLVLTIPTDDEFDRDTIGNIVQISAKYYTEELNSGSEAGYNDQNFASIDGTRLVKIIEDVFVGVDYLFPIPLVRTIDGGIKVIQLHTFAKYKNNQFVDVTANTRLASTNFDEESFGINQTFRLSLGVGHAGQTFDQEGLRLNMDPMFYGKWTLLDVPGSPKGIYGAPIARFDPITNPAQIRMRLQPNEASVFNNAAAFAELGTVVVQGIPKVPTHFRVRSVLESGFVHTIVPVGISEYNEFTIIDTNILSNKLSGYAANNDGVPYPIIVEFFIWNATTQTFEWISAVPFVTQQYVFMSINA
jgi:hypothetical protein